MSELGIGIDLGGTLIKGAAFDLQTGERLHQEDAPTRDGEREGGGPAFVAEIRKLVHGFEEKAGCECTVVGVSSPGFANKGASHIVSMPGRLAGLEGLEWPEALHRKAAVLNDAHAALMGEIWQGAAAGVRDVIMLTLGTGVGGAIVSDGQLLRGHFGKGGHLGHVSVDLMGAPDICGIPGALEDMIGNHNVAARSGGRFKSTRELVAAMQGGDQIAKDVWERSIRALAVALASYVNVLDPELVLIGGGISQAWDEIETRLKDWMDEFEWRPGGGQVEIRRASLGEWAGAFGAAYFAMKRHTTE
jgi:glucokinase